ncbi:hypothetical protein M413DRAFT_28891 [Hebeloma cylindrosporum]|uniref:Uncharacterized protein n=1 Tax=Hebeloma cylindrosporum TaxID=76867 RepID=A0A0C3C626_HEBCY|nr:hypothetical protein M413DRAFT_28891 [Hebeloma cylindrosporum h7]
MAPTSSSTRTTSIANAAEVAEKFKNVELLCSNPSFSASIWLAALDETAVLAAAWAPKAELVNADDVAREVVFNIKKLYTTHKSIVSSYTFSDAFWGVSNLCKTIVEGRKTKNLPSPPRGPRGSKDKAPEAVEAPAPPSTGNAPIPMAMDVDIEQSRLVLPGKRRSSSSHGEPSAKYLATRASVVCIPYASVPGMDINSSAYLKAAHTLQAAAKSAAVAESITSSVSAPGYVHADSCFLLEANDLLVNNPHSTDLLSKIETLTSKFAKDSCAGSEITLRSRVGELQAEMIYDIHKMSSLFSRWQYKQSELITITKQLDLIASK